MSEVRPNWPKTGLIVLGALIGVVLLLRLTVRRVTVETVTGPVDSAPSAASGEAAQASPTVTERTYDIVTLLPPDAIPAIDDPRFYPAAEADREYGPGELVLGVSIDGDSRAYSAPLLSRHEIVNDTVGGRKIAVTW